MDNSKICLRQGYNCQCEFCLPWISRWESEVRGFAALNNMLNEGKSLFHIYERLRSEHVDILTTHGDYIVDEYYKRVYNNTDNPNPIKKKRIILDDSSTSTVASG
jgi:phosphodiesterase/alkaline phosphatase D-like protein